MDDAEFSELQAALGAQPEAGDVIPGTGGCRKLRWRAQGRGKRGGYRVILFPAHRRRFDCAGVAVLKKRARQRGTGTIEAIENEIRAWPS